MPGPDRIDQKRELAGRREAERKRARQQPPGRLEHEELARRPGIEVSALEAEQRVGADRLGAATRSSYAQAPTASSSIRSCSESGCSARAPAIACTAVAAPASVVMHGMRDASAASRIA